MGDAAADQMEKLREESLASGGAVEAAKRAAAELAEAQGAEQESSSSWSAWGLDLVSSAAAAVTSTVRWAAAPARARPSAPPSAPGAPPGVWAELTDWHPPPNARSYATTYAVTDPNGGEGGATGEVEDRRNLSAVRAPPARPPRRRRTAHRFLELELARF